jgi:NADH dehydrogenase FAD-containing subunit
MTSKDPTRILILGGGFGGVYTALALEKKLERELDEGRVEQSLVAAGHTLPWCREIHPGAACPRTSMCRDCV